MLNWEMEFKKFLPGFKILSYYGNQRERKEKRVGWQKENAMNVCITSYQLVLADQHIFRRKAWMYLILDEAHHIKNFRAKRWQTLLGFHSQRRLLLTGTPLQNNLMDLWSLMYFLMPHGIDEATGGGAFASIKDFQEWFANPLDKAIQRGDGVDAETRDMVSKLHTVLRPFILRRLKSEVERELPHKYEHVIRCRLSKRQRFLYNDFLSRAATRQSLASGNYLSIINCLMQLRKVCNHPDLFEVRPIVTSFAMGRAVAADYEIKDFLVRRHLLARQDEATMADRDVALNLGFSQLRSQLVTEDLSRLDASPCLAAPMAPDATPPPLSTSSIEKYRASMAALNEFRYKQRWSQNQKLNAKRCQADMPVYSEELLRTARTAGQGTQLLPLSVAERDRTSYMDRCDAALDAVQPYVERTAQVRDLVDCFAFATPAVYAPNMAELALPGVEAHTFPELREHERDILHPAAVKLQIAFPDASLLQYDCGKLQQLDLLMRRLKDGGHRILIFTQMTKVLDILESFLSFHGYRYLRLDGATKVEDRQLLTERFNRDPRIMAFILSTRSGGLGINLTGADTVLFYDLDWNAAIEQQCMDRAHRIGQTRDVHIYRFVSEHTIEENMLKKANQKRLLDTMVIQQAEFSTDSLLRSDWRDMLDDGGRTLAGVHIGDEASTPTEARGREVERAMLAAEDEEDRAAAQAARQEMMVDLPDWTNEAHAHTHTQTHTPTSTSASTPAADPSGAQDGTELGVVAEEEEAGLEGTREGGGEEEEVGDDEGVEGTVDDYMLRWVEEDWGFFANL